MNLMNEINNEKLRAVMGVSVRVLTFRFNECKRDICSPRLKAKLPPPGLSKGHK